VGPLVLRGPVESLEASRPSRPRLSRSLTDDEFTPSAKRSEAKCPRSGPFHAEPLGLQVMTIICP
jgi:hypothetical protein